MTWRKRDTVIMRHGFTATRSPDNLMERSNGDTMTLRYRLGFTATRSTNDLFAWKYGDIVMGRPRDTVTKQYGFTATRSTGDLAVRRH